MASSCLIDTYKLNLSCHFVVELGAQQFGPRDPVLKESCEGTECAIGISVKVHVWDLVHMLPADSC